MFYIARILRLIENVLFSFLALFYSAIGPYGKGFLKKYMGGKIINASMVQMYWTQT